MVRTMSKMVSLYAIEEQEIYRELYKSVFSCSRPGATIELLGTSTNGDIGVLRNTISRLNPDVLLVGTKKIDSSIIEELGQIRLENPQLGLLLLSVLYDAETAKLVRKLAPRGGGGMALFLKQSLDQVEQLCGTVLAVSQGQVILAPELVTVLFTENTDRQFLRKLTTRELEIVGLLSKGYTNNAIAEFLFIDMKTVAHHINNMYSKLKAEVDFDDRHPRVSVARLYLEAAGELLCPDMLAGQPAPLYSGQWR
jgi:NarL family two-component system response regulator LiaR